MMEAAVRGFEVDAAMVAVLQLEVPLAASLDVAKHVRPAGERVIWNFAPAPSAFAARDLSDLFGATDILVVNEHAAIAAATLLGCKTDDIRHAGSHLSGSGCLCVVTVGAQELLRFTLKGKASVPKRSRSGRSTLQEPVTPSPVS
jgi:ribokinase